MTIKKPLIAFEFAYCAKRPKSAHDLNRNAWLLRQRRLILSFATASNRPIAKEFIDTPTYRGTTFAQSAKFHEATAFAIAQNGDLVVGDVQELLRRTPGEKILGCVKVLDGSDVEIYDATLKSSWSSLSHPRRQEILLNAARERSARSEAVKFGLKLAGKKRKAPRPDALEGSRMNRIKADNAAARLREFVGVQKQKLEPGTSLSPSALAKALNEANIPSSRGGNWTYNSAKNLMVRLEQLP
jgi:hypothetical protein